LFWDWLQLAPMTWGLFQYISIIVIGGIILSTIISYFINRYLDKDIAER
jgi:cation-transporting ATPase E